MNRKKNKLKRKNAIIVSIIIIAVAAAIGVVLAQSSQWSRISFEAVVKEIVTQPDGEVRLLVERRTNVYGSPLNSLGISRDTKLLNAEGRSISPKDIRPGSFVKITAKDAFTEETPVYYPVVYEIRVTSSDR